MTGEAMVIARGRKAPLTFTVVVFAVAAPQLAPSKLIIPPALIERTAERAGPARRWR